MHVKERTAARAPSYRCATAPHSLHHLHDDHEHIHRLRQSARRWQSQAADSLSLSLAALTEAHTSTGAYTSRFSVD